VFFRIKSSATLRKLMNAYCDRQSVDPSSIAFLFDGRRLRAEQTPAEVCSPLFSSHLQMLEVGGFCFCCLALDWDSLWKCPVIKTLTLV
jgi:hypothetical protein